MTNLEIYQALSTKGRRGAKKQVREKVGVSVNMITRVLKHGYPSAYGEQIVEEALKVIETFEAREAEIVLMRYEAAKKRYIAAQKTIQLLAVA